MNLSPLEYLSVEKKASAVSQTSLAVPERPDRPKRDRADREPSG